MLRMLPSLCQHTLKTEDNVNVIIDNNGDTLIAVPIYDAKIIIQDLMEYRYCDSLLVEYEKNNSLLIEKVEKQNEIINNKTKEISNCKKSFSYLSDIIKNKDVEIDQLNELIKIKNKEIRKQMFLKKLGFSGCVILPILILLL